MTAIAHSDSLALWPEPLREAQSAGTSRLVVFVLASIAVHLLLLTYQANTRFPPSHLPGHLEPLTVTLQGSPSEELASTSPMSRENPQSATTDTAQDDFTPIETVVPTKPVTPDKKIPSESITAAPIDAFWRENPESLVRKHYRPSDNAGSDSAGSKLALHAEFNSAMRTPAGALNIVAPGVDLQKEDIVTARAKCLVVPFVFSQRVFSNDSTITMVDGRCRTRDAPILFGSNGNK
jgi:hypothetical protein